MVKAMPKKGVRSEVYIPMRIPNRVSEKMAGAQIFVAAWGLQIGRCTHTLDNKGLKEPERRGPTSEEIDLL
jgi:hypothetical protein